MIDWLIDDWLIDYDKTQGKEVMLYPKMISFSGSVFQNIYIIVWAGKVGAG